MTTGSAIRTIRSPLPFRSAEKCCDAVERYSARSYTRYRL